MMLLLGGLIKFMWWKEGQSDPLPSFQRSRKLCLREAKCSDLQGHTAGCGRAECTSLLTPVWSDAVSLVIFFPLCFTSAIVRNDLTIRDLFVPLRCILVKGTWKIKIKSWCSFHLFTHLFTFYEKSLKLGFVFYKAWCLHFYIMSALCLGVLTSKEFQPAFCGHLLGQCKVGTLAVH